MIQWICGQLEASYVGERSKLALPRADSHERRYQLRVLRAAVRDVRTIPPPADARPPVLDPPAEEPATASAEATFDAPRPSFRQARIDQAHVAALRGPGSFFEGALFDVRVSGLQLAYPSEKHGRAYGQMRGTVVACLVLPPEPAPERVPASELVQEPAPPPPPGALHVPVIDADAASDEHPPLPEDAPSPPSQEARAPRLLPWLASCAFACLALALARGAMPAVLWTLFMLPTLAARRLLAGVLPDVRGMQLAGAALVLVQLVCTFVLLQSRWSADCQPLSLLPLLGLIAVLFPAGLLASPVPLACNAACLAAVLFGWCTLPG